MSRASCALLSMLELSHIKSPSHHVCIHIMWKVAGVRIHRYTKDYSEVFHPSALYHRHAHNTVEPQK